MRTIYKYPLSPGIFELKMPAGAKVLTAFTQNNTGFLWAEVDTDKQVSTERFMVIGTGHEFPSQIRDKTHLATFSMPPFIWHLYKVTLK